MTITEPGIYDIPAADYHADPCPTPSLSSSIARALLSSSAEHARFKHPRLNHALVEEHDDKFDRGTAAHAYLLQGETGCVLIDAPDFKTQAARAQRAGAWLDGKVPLLTKHWEDVLAMAEEAKRRLDLHEDRPRPFTAGKPEQTLIWCEDDVWCRARLDWLHDDQRVIDDYKTGKVAASPFTWDRHLYGMGYDVQAAFYLRGLHALTGRRARFRFVPQENFAPFALAVIELSHQALDLASRKVDAAIERWRECLTTDTWPGYPRHTCTIEVPPWELTRWEEREAARAFTPVSTAVHDDGRPLSDQLFEAQEEC